MAIDPNKVPRKMTDGEITFFKGWPNLHPNEVTVIGLASRKYNCVAYSLGFTERWINFGTKTQFATMFLHYYHISCDAASAEIDVYAIGETPRHAARKDTATHCSSKMGDLVVLEHLRAALEDSGPKPEYGLIYGHFKKDASHPGNSHPSMPPPDHPENPRHELPQPLPVGHPSGPPPITGPTKPPRAPTGPIATHGTPTGPTTSGNPATSNNKKPPTTTSGNPATSNNKKPPTTTSSSNNQKPPPHGVRKEVLKQMDAFDPIPPPADEAIASVDQLHESLSTAYPDAATNFDQLYDAWKKTWDDEDKRLSSNSEDFAKGPEFDALVRLGPASIPFVLKRLASPDDFFAIHLYNAIETDAGVKVEEDNLLDYLVLQRHANLLVDMNHQRNQTFNNKVKEWMNHQDMVAASSDSADKVNSEAFRTIVEMGQSVIGHAMEAYSKEPDGWWHEALHEIVHGQPSGSMTFFKDKLFSDWKKWFESGKGAEHAPGAPQA